MIVSDTTTIRPYGYFEPSCENTGDERGDNEGQVLLSLKYDGVKDGKAF
jgi:hypothetical protein